MRAIQMTEFGGPEVLELVDLPTPEPAAGEVLIEVTRAGLNFADTHQRENAYLAKYELPLVPGGEVAGVRDDTGERVVALVRDRRLRRVRASPGGAVLPDPRRRRRRHRARAAAPGPDRLAPVPHLRAACAAGESVVVLAGAGGVGSLRGPARPRRSARAA